MHATLHDAPATRDDNATDRAAHAPRGTDTLYRIDRFLSPGDQQGAFADRLAIIHGHFSSLPGCLYNRVAVSPADKDGMVSIVTIVEWRDRAALDGAKAALADHYARSGFDPAAFMAERGIQGEFGLYRPMLL